MAEDIKEPVDNEETEEINKTEDCEEKDESGKNDESTENDTSSEAPSDDGEKEENKKSKKKKKDKKDEQIEELNDRLKRQMAEFDNFRKRTEKEKTQMFETGAKSIVEKLLDVVDSFERALSGVPEEKREDPFVDGMDKVYKQMMTKLSEAGVCPIEALGKEFDPEYHNAIQHIDDDSFGENIVAEEFQKGYMYRETVVRHSMVKVAN